MRRSTKTALAAAFLIATIGAQLAPHDIEPIERYELEIHRAERIEAILAKLNSNGQSKPDVFYRILAQVDRIRTMRDQGGVL